MFFVLIIALLFVLSALIVGYSLAYGISPMPTSRKVKKSLYSLLPPLERGVIYELGSGWGGVAVALAKKYPHLTIIAYEISPLPYLISSLRRGLSRHHNLIIRRKDFLKEPLTHAGLIYCYLYPKGMKRLSKRLYKENNNTFLVSNTFTLPGERPFAQKKPLFLYKLINT